VHACYSSPGPGLPRSGPAPRCLPPDALLFFLRLRSWPCGDAPLSRRRFFFLHGPPSTGLRAGPRAQLLARSAVTARGIAAVTRSTWKGFACHGSYSTCCKAHAHFCRRSRASRAWRPAWRLSSVRRLCAGGCCGQNGRRPQSRPRAHRLCLARRPPSPTSLSLRARAAPARHACAALAHAPAARAASQHTHPRHPPPQPAPPASEAALGEEQARRRRGAPAAPGVHRSAASMARRQAPGHLLCCGARAGSGGPQRGARVGEGHARHSCCGSAWQRSAVRARGPCRRRSRHRRRRCCSRSRPRCSQTCLRAPPRALEPAAQPCCPRI